MLLNNHPLQFKFLSVKLYSELTNMNVFFAKKIKRSYTHILHITFYSQITDREKVSIW